MHRQSYTDRHTDRVQNQLSEIRDGRSAPASGPAGDDGLLWLELCQTHRNN